MIKCEQCLETLSAYLDGELPEAEMKKIDTHLKECSACSEELELLKAIVSVCNDLTEELPESFETSLHKRLEKAKEDFQDTKRKALNLRLISQIAAGFIIVITLGIFVRVGIGGVKTDQSGKTPAQSLKVAEGIDNMNTTLAKSSRNGETARGEYPGTAAATALTPGTDNQDGETTVEYDKKEIFTITFAENGDKKLKKVEGQDTQVRIETEDLPDAVKSIMIIEEKLGDGSDESKSKLQKLMTDFGGTREGPVEMELYYPDDESWHTFLSELQDVFPNMVIESVPAKGEEEQIRIILCNSHD